MLWWQFTVFSSLSFYENFANLFYGNDQKVAVVGIELNWIYVAI